MGNIDTSDIIEITINTSDVNKTTNIRVLCYDCHYQNTHTSSSIIGTNNIDTSAVNDIKCNTSDRNDSNSFIIGYCVISGIIVGLYVKNIDCCSWYKLFVSFSSARREPVWCNRVNTYHVRRLRRQQQGAQIAARTIHTSDVNDSNNGTIGYCAIMLRQIVYGIVIVTIIDTSDVNDIKCNSSAFNDTNSSIIDTTIDTSDVNDSNREILGYYRSKHKYHQGFLFLLSSLPSSRILLIRQVCHNCSNGTCHESSSSSSTLLPSSSSSSIYTSTKIGGVIQRRQHRDNNNNVEFDLTEISSSSSSSSMLLPSSLSSNPNAFLARNNNNGYVDTIIEDSTKFGYYRNSIVIVIASNANDRNTSNIASINVVTSIVNDGYYHTNDVNNNTNKSGIESNESYSTEPGRLYCIDAGIVPIGRNRFSLSLSLSSSSLIKNATTSLDNCITENDNHILIKNATKSLDIFVLPKTITIRMFFCYGYRRLCSLQSGSVNMLLPFCISS